MQLTQEEKQIVEYTRRNSNQWLKARWIALPLLSAIVALAVTYCFIAQPFIGYALAGFAGFRSVIQLLRICQWWKGVPKDKLLLKLADNNEMAS